MAAAIEASASPSLPTQLVFTEEAGEILSDSEIEVAEEPPVAAIAFNDELLPMEETLVELASTESEDPVHLALNSATEEILPPAAVLPDNIELEIAVTPEEETAVAIDPVLDVSESNEQLAEALAADPSDYTVASNNSIEIQASETLGHYADWLGIRAWDLRRLNNMAFRDPVIIGERLALDFSRVNIAEF